MQTITHSAAVLHAAPSSNGGGNHAPGSQPKH
jgi:hypothetical protein